MKNLKSATFRLSFLIALLCLQGCGAVTKEDIDKAIHYLRKFLEIEKQKKGS